MLRALGMPPGALVRALVGEALLVSGVGVLVGLPLGIGFAQLIVQPVAETMSLNLQQVVTASQVAVRPGPLLLAGGAGLLAGALAALRPALRASRARIVTVLAAGRMRDVLPEGRVKQWPVPRSPLPPWPCWRCRSSRTPVPPRVSPWRASRSRGRWRSSRRCAGASRPLGALLDRPPASASRTRVARPAVPSVRRSC